MQFVKIKHIQIVAADSLPEVYINPEQVIAIYDRNANNFVDIWMTTYADSKGDKWQTFITAMGQVEDIGQRFIDASSSFLKFKTIDYAKGSEYDIYVNVKQIMNIRASEGGTALYLRGSYTENKTILHIKENFEDVQAMIANLQVSVI